MTEKLRPCPFCGGEARLQLTDEEGNFRDESYLENPYSGVGYVIMHDTNNSTSDCPIATDSDSSQGSYIYESKEEAIITWNKRDCNDTAESRIESTIDIINEEIEVEKKAIKNYRNVIRTHLDRSDGLSEWHNDQISYMNDIVNRKALTINLKEDILNNLKWIKQECTTSKWIPFTFDEEGVLNCELPDVDEEILVSDGDSVWQDTWCEADEGYELFSGIEIEDLAWRQLPKPYEENQNENNC